MSISRGPKIVKDGLVLCVDAADYNSYVPTGTLWKDLTPNNSNGVFSGTALLPTYNSNNKGNIQINGSGSCINFGSALNFTGGGFSFNQWSYFTTLSGTVSGQNSPLFWKGLFNSNGYYFSLNTNGNLIYNSYQAGASQQTNINNNTIRTGTWYNISVTSSGSSVRIYLNGVDRTVTAGTHINPASSSSPFLLGQYGSPASFNSSGSFAMFAAYNKALSPVEVLQNYNALKGRFNLT
jgi:hypothetical protein